MNAYEKMHQAVLALDAWAKVVKDNPKDKTAIECAEFVEVTAKTALAASPRNCDRPNPEERYYQFCASQRACSTCPQNGYGDLRCDGRWLLATANGSEEKK